MSLTIATPARPRLPIHQLAWPLTLWLILTLLISLFPPAFPMAPPLPPPAGADQLTFTPAAGTAGPALFSVRSAGGAIGFLPDGLRLALPGAGCDGGPFDIAPLRQAQESGRRPATDDGAGGLPGCAAAPAAPVGLGLTFLGASPETRIEASGRTAGRTHLFIGDDPTRWRRDLPGYRELRYEQLYPGIDLRYSGRPGALKSVYELAPHADPAAIRWAYSGAAGVAVDAPSGDLRITLPDGRSLIERAPVAWQLVDGARAPVAVRFSLGVGGRELGGGAALPSVSFALGAYDPALPLTIDPWLEYGLALGGSSQEEGLEIARDSAGNIFVAGYTFSADFTGAETAPRAGRAAFVSKLDSEGSLIRSVILDGSLEDTIGALAVGPDDDVYLAGLTSSGDFPIQDTDTFQLTKGATGDGFVLRLSNDLATVRYGTFFGGSGFDEIYGIAVGSDGAAFLTGLTTSADLQVTAGNLRAPTVEGRCYGGLSDCHDVFVSKLSPDGRGLVYSTYYGGSEWEGNAFIAVDSQDRAYVAGQTTSTDLLTSTNALQLTYAGGECASGPTPVPCADLFLARLTVDGRLDYGTYLGGGSADYTPGITVDTAGRAYLTGSTFSADFPTERATQPASGSTGFIGGEADAFISVVSADGQSLEFSTYLGGTASDGGNGIAIDGLGGIYVTGITNTPDFPVVAPLQATSRNTCATNPNPPFGSDCWDGFLAKFDLSTARLLFGTLLSGSQQDLPQDITVDPTTGDIYLAGFTTSSDLPIGVISGPKDAFIFKLTESLLPDDWYVAPGGSDLNDCRAPERACATIGAALSRADAGSTIFIAAGTYAENLTVARDVTLLGAGQATTIIDGGGRGRVIDIRPGVTATIEGVTAQNGALRLDWAFRDTADLAEGRVGHSATFINEGVLVAGGVPTSALGTPVASAAIFNTTTNTWRPIAAMTTPRVHHAAVRLNDGSVVVIGGLGTGGVPLSSVERYYPDNPSDPDDPPEGRWVDLAPLPEARQSFTAVLLHGHEILVAGGVGVDGNPAPLASTAIYTPRTNTWRAAAPLPAGRWYHTMTLLDDGDVLVAGGIRGDGSVTAESLRYDPAANTWTPTGLLNTPRAYHAAALLQGDLAVVDGQATLTEGKVLVAGGLDLRSAEIFDPATNSWIAVPDMATQRKLYSLITLASGEVLAAGGLDETLVSSGGTGAIPSAEIYSPRTGAWRPAGNLLTPRYEQTATPYGYGQVLFVGGFGTFGGVVPGLAEVERYGVGTINHNTDLGAGIRVPGAATLTLLDSTVRDNWADLGGGGIFNRGTLRLERSTVRENRANASPGGAGILNDRGDDQGEVELIDSQVIENYAQGAGSGIASSGTLTMLRSQVNTNVTHNTIACCGAGSGISASGPVTLTDSQVNGNLSGDNWGQQHSGGIFYYGSLGQLRLIRSQVNNNQVIATSGYSALAGGVFIHPQQGEPRAEIFDSTIGGNIVTAQTIGAGAGGAGMFISGGTVVLSNTNVLSNTTRNPLGSTGGAGIHNGARIEIYGGSISGNSAEGGSSAGMYNSGTTIISGTLISNNSADYGGGGGIASLGLLTISGATIRGNRAHLGGGIYSTGALTITDSLITDNQAVDGQPGPTQGGGMWLGGSATLSGVTIRGNSSTGAGGGLWINSGATARIAETSVISGNQAAAGGGGISSSGTLTIVDSTVSDNQTLGNTQGGGIRSAGPLTLERVMVSDNRTEDGWGGGIAVSVATTALIKETTLSGNSARVAGALGVFDGATIDLIDSSIISNTAYYGGAIDSGGNVTLRNGVIRNNQTVRDPNNRFGGEGGAITIPTFGTLSIIQSEINGNRSVGIGGGIYMNGSAVVTITQSTLKGNTAVSPGGAIAAQNGTLSITDSTLSGNSSGYVGGAIFSGGTLTVTNTTFSGNRAGLTISGPGSAIFGAGPTRISFSTVVDNEVINGYGALVNPNQSGANPFTIEGSIVAGNRAPFAPDLCNYITSAGHNLIGVTTTTNECAYAPAAGDQVGTVAAPLDPMLGPLANNGGPTWTHAPYPGSPALNAGGPTCPATDQRGVARPQQGRCDVGAVEVENPQVFFGDLEGFNAAAGSPPALITFDTLPVGDEISGDTIAGVTFLQGEQPAPSAPLIVARGADTFTPGGSTANRLTPTSGEQVLSPGGGALALGPAPLVENDDLELRFDPPAAAVGFDILYQSLDCCSFVGVTVYGAGDQVLYRNPSIPTGASGAGTPGGAVFFGVSSPTAPIYRVVIDEFDGDSGNPDANIGFDTVRVSLPPGDLYVATSGSDANDCQSPDTPCRTIRSALARAAAGSTVNVAPGSYREVISISRDVRIVGAGREATVIDGAGRNLPVTGVIPGVTATISDLTITGGSVQVPNSNGGGGIYSQGDLTLERVAVRQNRHNGGAGGIGNYGTLTLRDSLVEGNTGAYGGIGNFGTLTVIGSTVVRNTAESTGGGITSTAGTTLRIEGGSAISENTATTSGGGINSNGALSIADSTIEGNTTAAGSGGGIYSSGTLSIADSTITGNTANSNGGGIFSSGNTTITGGAIDTNESVNNYGGGIFSTRVLTLNQATLSNNRAPKGSGGGVALYDNAQGTLSGNTISANNARGGGGIFVDQNAELTFRGGTITENLSTGYGGGISLEGTVTISETTIADNVVQGVGVGILNSAGGGIHNNGTLTVIDSEIRANRLGYPEDYGIWQGNREWGGGIYSQAGSRLTVIRTTIADHQVGGDPGFSGGGGILLDTNATLQLIDSQIVDNKALGRGAGLVTLTNTQVTITGSTFSGNRLIYPGDENCPPTNCNQGAAINGAGVYTITNTTFSGNRSGKIASAIFWQGPVTSALEFVTITDNEAPSGGALWVNGLGPTVTVRNSIIAGNRADLGVTTPDCEGERTSLGGNVFGIGDECGAIGTDTINDPMLAPLADNGGPTWTHMPQLGSPAIDWARGDCPATDQRGRPRPAGRCDSGAVEGPETFTNDFVVTDEVWGFPNIAGQPTVADFITDFGAEHTTRLITETRLVDQFKGTASITMPVTFERDPTLRVTLPLTVAINGDPLGSLRVIDPIFAVYAETIVSRIVETPAARQYVGSLASGLCVGMAAGVAAVRQGSPPLAALSPTATVLREVTLDPDKKDEVERLIERYHGRQAGLQVMRHMATTGKHTTPDLLVQQLVARIGSPAWWADPLLIGIVQDDTCEGLSVGHALLPYRVETDGVVAHIYVYDPNYPVGSAGALPERKIVVNLSANDWTYDLGAGDPWTGQLIYSLPLSLLQQAPQLPTGDDDYLLFVAGAQRAAFGAQRAAFGAQRAAFGEDDQGLRTGCVIDADGNTRFVEEISRTLRLVSLNGPRWTPALPEAILFPSDTPLRFTTVSTTTDMLVFGDNTITGVFAPSTEINTDTLRISQDTRTIILETSSTDPKPVSAFQMHEHPSTNGEEQSTRFFAISNAPLNQGATVSMTVSPSLDQLSITNTSSQTQTADIGLALIGNRAISQITLEDQPIGPDERRTYTPLNWSALDQGAVLVSIDKDQDGVPEEVEVIPPPQPIDQGDVFPAAVLARSVPSTPGAQFPLITRDPIAAQAPDHYGWVSLDTPVQPGGYTVDRMRRDGRVLRRWLEQGGGPELVYGMRLVGVPGRQYDLFTPIGEPNPTRRGPLYHIDSVMRVPLYDQVRLERPGRPLSYRIIGYAVVRIVESAQGARRPGRCYTHPRLRGEVCGQRVIAELIRKEMFVPTRGGR